MAKRKFLFPWVCRLTGGFFFAMDWEPVHTCPICGKVEQDIETGSAFESGHCYRKWSESFFADERKKVQ